MTKIKKNNLKDRDEIIIELENRITALRDPALQKQPKVVSEFFIANATAFQSLLDWIKT